MNEIKIKTLLVGELIKTFPGAVIAAEVPFLFGERRADVVMINGDYTYVFEIKSKQDSVSRLEYQVKGYKEFFDYCFVVGEEENLKDIRMSVSVSVGLVSAGDNSVKFIREAKIIKRKNKLTLASVLPIKRLRQLVDIDVKGNQIELAKNVAKKYKVEELKNMARDCLVTKYSPRFNLMKSELGDIVTPDDIKTIGGGMPEFLCPR